MELISDGAGGIHQANRMGTYTRTSQTVRGFPIDEQNIQKLDKKQFLFVGPFGSWRIGPDTKGFTGSGLKNIHKSANPPTTGWQYRHRGKWIKDSSIEAILNIKGNKEDFKTFL